MSPDQIVFFARSLGGGLLAGGIAFAVGRRGVRLLALRCDSFWEEFSLASAGGLGIIACVAFGMGIAGILRPIPFGVALAFLVILSLIHPFRRGNTPPPLERGSALHQTALIVVLVLALPLFVLPLYPPTGPDAITYHLAVARKFAASGMVRPTPELRYAVFPQLAEMLFTSTLLLGDDITAQWMSFLALTATAAAVAAYVRRVGGEGADLWGAGLLLCNSSVLLLGAVAYGDMLLTAFVTVALLSFERWRGGGEERWLGVAGLMAGFAAGTKYSALFFPPVLLVMITAARSKRGALRPAIVFLSPCVLAALPWYLYNLYHAGNPVWPFFSGLFGLRYWNRADIAAQTSDLISQYGSGKSPSALLSLPWNLYAHGELFHTEGALSVLLLAGVPFAVYAIVRERSARRLAIIAVAYTIFWFFTAQILRYLVPVVPLYCAITAAGAFQFFRRLVGPGVFALGSAVLAFALFLPSSYLALRIEGTSGIPPSNSAERDRFLEKHLPSYGAVRFLNARAGTASTLYSYRDPQMAYFAGGEFRGDFFGPWRYSRLEGALNGRESVLLDTLRAMGVNYLLIRDDSSGSGCNQEWLTRRFVVPFYRSPDVALFQVSSVPRTPSYGQELVRVHDTTGNGSPAHPGALLTVTGERMYFCTCTGSADSAFANAALEISWLDEHGKQIRMDQASGVFLRTSSVLTLLSTSPPRTATASIALSTLGGATLHVTRMSVRELRFVSAFP